MLQNAYLLAKIGADTAENERKFAENLPKLGNYPTGPLRVPTPGGARQRRVGPQALLEARDARRKPRPFVNNSLTLLEPANHPAKINVTQSN